jgi:hypothetical protein
MGNSTRMKQRLWHIVLHPVMTLGKHWKHSIKHRAKIV